MCHIIHTMNPICIDTKAMHREFCSRLEAKGLLSHPKVVFELKQRNMCADMDFSDPDQYCAQFETKEALAIRRIDEQKCSKQISALEKFTRGFNL
jgi:hypothetical protein